jgi:FtsP/CotA-like multicopper oxidase with cupredoxin domain
MDFHAAEIAPSKYYVNVMPGDSLHYRFVARVPGAFMYHCGTAPAAMHIANGMYGAFVVDPAKPRPAAREFVFVQSEFYFGQKPAADGTDSGLRAAPHSCAGSRGVQPPVLTTSPVPIMMSYWVTGLRYTGRTAAWGVDRRSCTVRRP